MAFTFPTQSHTNYVVYYTEVNYFDDSGTLQTHYEILSEGFHGDGDATEPQRVALAASADSAFAAFKASDGFLTTGNVRISRSRWYSYYDGIKSEDRGYSGLTEDI